MFAESVVAEIVTTLLGLVLVSFGVVLFAIGIRYGEPPFRRRGMLFLLLGVLLIVFLFMFIITDGSICSIVKGGINF